MSNAPTSSSKGSSRSAFIPLLAVIVLIIAACGGDDDAAADATPSEVSVALEAPASGDTVSSPVTFVMSATGVVIEPAGAESDGAGHFHLMIDVPCVTPGERIPADESHFHYGDGSDSAELELSPGDHTVCLQLGDGLHTALDASDIVTFTVQG